MKRATKVSLLLVGALALAFGSAACKRRVRRHGGGGGGDGRRILTGAEIKALFSGKTVTGDHLKKHYNFRSYYAPAGAFSSFQQGAQTPRKGKWRVAGNNICIQWQGTPTELCRKMATDGKTYWKVKDKGDRLINIVRFKTFIAGNQTTAKPGAGKPAAGGAPPAGGAPAGGSGAPAPAAGGTAGGAPAGGSGAAPPPAATKGGAPPAGQPKPAEKVPAK